LRTIFYRLHCGSVYERLRTAPPAKMMERPGHAHVSAARLLFGVLLLTTGIQCALESESRTGGGVKQLKRTCRAVPGSPDWPSSSSWASFNQSLGGRLLAPTPPAAVCHSGDLYSVQKCAEVQSAWRFHEFHQADPVSTMWNQFNNFTCLPNANSSCSPSGYPTYVVNASEALHIKLGVQYGRYRTYWV